MNEHTMTEHEIQLVIKYFSDKESSYKLGQIFNDYYDNNAYDKKNVPCLIHDTLTMTIVDHKGGEGEGSEYYHIFKFEEVGKEPVYVKFNGYYESFDGMSYAEDAMSIVHAKEKTITVYE